MVAAERLSKRLGMFGFQFGFALLTALVPAVHKRIRYCWMINTVFE
jgi:hypothetical protein